MRSDEILADYLEISCFDCPDVICDQIPGTQENHEICTKCWLDWARSKADEKEVVFTEEEKVCFDTAISLLEIDPHVPFTAAENKVIESLKTKILGK